MKSCVIRLSVLVLMGSLAAADARSAPIVIENASFESPTVDPNAFPAWPVVDGWMEADVDELGSTNTGVFANTPPGSPDRLENADGNQLAFLGSQEGNALAQDVNAVYEVGCDYRLAVSVGVSGRFSPSAVEPVDMIEIVLYYVDGPNSVDIVSQSVEATGLSSTVLRDFSVRLPVVDANDPWVGKPVGIAIRAAGLAGGFWDLDNVRLEDSKPVTVAMANASFEAPPVDPNAFPALPWVDVWIELDRDEEGSTNTGVFANTPEGSPDRLENADGSQLAFLGSELGNTLAQDLEAIYEVGCDYLLTVGVGISSMFPPSSAEPVDALELALYFLDGPNSVDVANQAVEAAGLSSIQLQDFSVYLPAVEPNDAWAGKTVGVALRAAGMAGGFWDLDNVRLLKSVPLSLHIENASFESPFVDPNAFPALPFADGWTELDNDPLFSANTGVFANTAPISWDHMRNAHGRQLAFLGTQQGNAFEQDLEAVYQVGRGYRLTVSVGISGRYPPATLEPLDLLELALFYRVGDTSVDVACRAVDAVGLSQAWLTDFGVCLPIVGPEDPWAGKPIGIAIRAAGMAGGFWDLDNVRLAESVLTPDSTQAAKE
ncbi:MAG: hypothetical protein JW993_08320 [Sedimentisphaerales bacterium]|nr:hypothetical protein [Sedimentisphaerales bacterium]